MKHEEVYRRLGYLQNEWLWLRLEHRLSHSGSSLNNGILDSSSNIEFFYGLIDYFVGEQETNHLL